MNKKLIGLLVVSAMGLSACSSTGAVRNGHAEGLALGEGNSSSSNNSNNSNNSTSTSTSTSDTSTPASILSQGFIIYSNGLVIKKDGSVEVNDKGTPEPEDDEPIKRFDVNGEGTDGDANYLAPSTVDEINTLKVEGRNILLIPEDKIGVKDWYVAEKPLYTGSASTGVNGTDATVNSNTTRPYNGEPKSWAVVGNQLNHAKFGEIYDQFEKRYLFAQGESTASGDMPTARGQVQYSGHATYNAKAGLAYSAQPILGRSEFIVDFGEKSVVGQIQPVENPTAENNFDPVILKATIEGNKFQGIHNHYGDDTSHNASTTGGFYGKNAEEMAGTYFYTEKGSLNMEDINATKPMGTFGASKK